MYCLVQSKKVLDNYKKMKTTLVAGAIHYATEPSVIIDGRTTSGGVGCKLWWGAVY